MAIELSTSKECRSAYRELLQGYTYCEEKNFYIKHFKESDLGFIDEIYRQCYASLKKAGISPLKEKLEFLREEEYWTREEEQSFTEAGLAVKDAYIYVNKLVDEDQKKEFIKTIVAEQEENLKKITKERYELVEPTIETICDKRINEFYVYHAVYKDPELTEHLFTKEEFEEISFFELGDLVRVYNHETSKLAEKNLKKISVNYFFLNSFFMCDDDPVKFYGKNILELTMYQMNLFSRGRYCKSILMEGEEPPDQYYEDTYENGLQELVQWFDNANAKLMNKRANEKMKAKRG